MEIKLKQRVIGAVVLTTLAIIILPMLLDGSKQDRARVAAAIPNPPQIEIKNLNIAHIKQAQLEMEQESERGLPVEIADDKSETPDQVSGSYLLDKNHLPVSWTLQLGSFRQSGNATRLRQSLRDARFRSYILTGDSSEGQVYRVYVGPMLNKVQLLSFAQDIESKFDLKGQIIRYRIEDDVNQLGG